MAKAKKQPKQYRLYLVVAVDPHWNGKQHYGRFYKFGITTKKNVLDRHPSYTEVLLSKRISCRWSGTHIESFVREHLRILGFHKGDTFSTEAVRCSDVSAELIATIVNQEWALTTKGIFDKNMIWNNLYMHTSKKSIEDKSKEILDGEKEVWEFYGNDWDKETAEYCERAMFWYSRIVEQFNAWKSLPQPQDLPPMW